MSQPYVQIYAIYYEKAVMNRNIIAVELDKLLQYLQSYVEEFIVTHTDEILYCVSIN